MLNGSWREARPPATGQKEAARKLGVDPSTWSTSETGGTIMGKAHRRLIATFIGLPVALE
jgi:hypothetical protein